MDPHLCSAVFLTLSCWLWNAEGQEYKLIVDLVKGENWGRLGHNPFCSKGHANGFALKDCLTMDPRFRSAMFLILSCWLWNAEGRKHNTILGVRNEGKWGKSGKGAFCSEGHANGFSLKVQPPQGHLKDDTSVNGIRLYCTNGEVIEDATGPKGDWTTVQKCATGHFVTFALQVEDPQGMGDDTAVNNIKFKCQDGKVLTGSSTTNWGKFGEWSYSCSAGAICGMYSTIEPYRLSPFADNTGLNDVEFPCCD